MKQCLQQLILTTLLSLIFTSCAEDIDFNQSENLKISPVLEASLAFFDEQPPVFLDDGTEITTVEDFIELGIFDGAFIQDNLTRAEFVIETLNSINRKFELQVDFFNQEGTLEDSFTLALEPSPNNDEITTNHVEVFRGERLNRLKNSSILLFSLRLLPGEIIQPGTPGRIQLKSKVVLYLNTDNV